MKSAAAVLIVLGIASAFQARPPAPRFDVVSVKPCAPHVDPLNTQRSGKPGTMSPGRLYLECLPLAGPTEPNPNSLMRLAYGLHADGLLMAYWSVPKVEGGPDWIRTERYTIEATASGAPTKEMMRGPMLQSILEDRFALRVHKEMREIPVYELTVARGGSKLRPFDGACKPVDFTKGDLVGQLEAEGSCPIALRGSRIDAPGETIEDFIRFALTTLDRPVVDKTGLAGRFDIHVDLPTDDNKHSPSDLAETLAVAMQQQLGLRLVPARGQGQILVIDHVEHPKSNRPSASEGAGRTERGVGVPASEHVGVVRQGRSPSA